LSTADDEHGGVSIAIFGGGLPEIEPVWSTEIAGISLALRPRSSEPLLVSL
jgi:hypothetical protein